MDREQRRVQKLYLRFRKDLTKWDTPADYDENDLIEIYDYAFDEGDEYVQLSVLLSAARIYPESEELLQRRGYYFYDRMSLAQGASDMASIHRADSAIWAVLWELVQLPATEYDREKAFDTILDRYSGFDDETIIRLVNTCSALDMYDWFKKHKDDIQRLCLYPDTFLYELSEEARIQADFRFAVELLEELTRMVPFNQAYWVLLSKSYFELGDMTDALSAVDYALAIDAKSISAITQKMVVLFNIQGRRDQAINIGAEAIDNGLFDAALLYQYVFMLSYDDTRKREAANILLEYMDRFSGDNEFMDHLLEIGAEDINMRALDRYYCYESAESIWMDWAKEYFSLRYYSVCRDILMSYLKNSGSMPEWTILFEVLYRLGEHEMIFRLHERHIKNKGEFSFPYMAQLFFALSLLWLGNIDKARTELLSIANIDVSEIGNYETRINYIGIKDIASAILDKLSCDDFDINSVDPFRDNRLSK